MAEIKTCQKILNSATRMFAQRGYDGTIMDDLAEQCEVNKASIYYHHKDKATLYDNALTELFTPIADAIVKAVEAESGPEKKLESHIKTFASTSAENPDFAAIIMREMASGGANMPARAHKQMQRILFLLIDILQLGESQGIFKCSNALIIHFMILGTINLFVASIPLRKSLPKTARFNKLRYSDINSASEQLSNTIIASLLIN